MNEYTVVVALSPKKLEKRVVALMDEGWFLGQGFSVTPIVGPKSQYMFSQPMVRFKPNG